MRCDIGYEVSYKYHERLEGGKYNTEEVKELKKNIGNALDEFPLEKLASIIMGQLARRDIWIIDVEIEEFIKKKLNFKESNDGKGIIIKGKKFSFNGSVDITSEDVEIEAVEAKSVSQPVQKYPPNNLANRASNVGKPKSWMIFDPEIQNLHEAKQKSLKFTVAQRYPIYNITEHPLGLTYGQIFTTVDDTGTTITISDKFFVPANIRLVGDNEVPGGFSQSPMQDDGPKLSYGNELRTGAGDIRAPSANYQHIPIDNGQIPAEMYQVPDLGRRLK